MNRLFIFTAGLIVGIGATVLIGQLAFPDAAAASSQVFKGSETERLQPEISPQMQVLEPRCAPGFRHSPVSGGRYGCNRTRPVRCPRGTTPANLKLYRSGGDARGSARLLYDCRMSEIVRPQCGRGFAPANLKLYRSGGSRGGSRLIYECVRYRNGN